MIYSVFTNGSSILATRPGSGSLPSQIARSFGTSIADTSGRSLLRRGFNPRRPSAATEHGRAGGRHAERR